MGRPPVKTAAPAKISDDPDKEDFKSKLEAMLAKGRPPVKTAAPVQVK